MFYKKLLNERTGNCSERTKKIIKNAIYIKRILKYLRLSEEDYFNVGFIGLIKAVDTYNPSMETKLSTYAQFLILKTIKTYERDNDKLKRVMRSKVKKFRLTEEELTKRFEREPTLSEIAFEMGVDYDYKFAEIVNSSNLETYDLYILDVYDFCSSHDHLKKEAEDTFAEEISRKQQRVIINRELKKLPKRDRDVLLSYYFEEKTQKEIADSIKRTPSRISQIRDKAISKLKKNKVLKDLYYS